MIIRRLLLIIGAVLAMIMVGASTMSGSQLSSAINELLPKEWKVDMPETISPSWEKASLAQIRISYLDCPLITAEQLSVQWFEQQKISLDKATIDYACLEKFPRSDDKKQSSSDSIKAILATLPNGEVHIHALYWINLPEAMNPRLKALLDSPSQSHLSFYNNKLTFSVKQKLAEISADLANMQLNAQIRYQPSESEQHQLQLSALLDDDLFTLPPQISADYQWKIPEQIVSDPALQQGKSNLVWHRDEAKVLRGNLALQSLAHNENQLTLPFWFDHQSIGIEQARVDWQLSESLPLRGFVTTKLTPKTMDLGDLYPIKTSLRISLLTENDKGKGNIVISNQSGEIQQNSVVLPLQITGNIKHEGYILYSSIPLDIRGPFDDITLRFQPGSLLRLTGKERFLTINELRFPLAGIQVDKYGINGRLQAIFKGESPDFSTIEMHLDGFANNFKAGALDFFNDQKEDGATSDLWQWRFWGNSHFKPANSKLSVSGRGDWHQDLVRLSEFKGELGQIKRQGVFVPKTELSLSEPIHFAYQNFHLSGGITLKSPMIGFQYGGLLEKPTAALSFQGETENLQLRGSVSAGKLGPIKLFASRKLTETSSSIVGRLYWNEQSANVFQTLFPFRNNWVITNGTIKGETAFSANTERGLIAGGHFSIRHGGLSLPEGDIKGIEFSLPYQLKNNEVDIGLKKPLEAKVAEINIGIPITNVKVKVQGHIPYSKRKPLFLQELSLDLLGGRLNVERFALPQTKVAYLNLYDIRFEEILSLAQYHQVELTGKANAVFPFWLSGKPCYICNGTLTQAEKSYLKLTPDLLKAINQGGYTEQILAYMVNKSEIDDFSATVNLDGKGDMDLSAQIHSRLTEHQQAKVNLNYHHKENMFDLWKLINYGSQFEQNIEHSIYQQLDKQ
ncbi:YdbH family protein [Glaesserella sp.]|uniref:YdbH family protein n=1 Tax=Glaesserella sp. TaxID=2094731 RepID=UPI00359FB1DF